MTPEYQFTDLGPYKSYLIKIATERFAELGMRVPTILENPENKIVLVDSQLLIEREQRGFTKDQVAKKINDHELYIFCAEHKLRFPPTDEEIREYSLPQPNHRTLTELKDALLELYGLNQ